jgi:hypothetical protein
MQREIASLQLTASPENHYHAAVIVRPARRLPRQFSRPVSKSVRSFVERRALRRRKHRQERWLRLLRRAERALNELRERLWQWLIIGSASVALLLIGLAVFSPIMHVRAIRVARTDERLDIEAVQRSLTPLFGKHLFLISSRDVGDLLETAVPDMEGVTIQKHYPSTLGVRIALEPFIAQLQIKAPPKKIATPGAGTTLLLSGATAPDALAQRKTFDYLTAKGRYISLAFAESGAALPAIELTDIDTMPTPGTVILSPDFLARMQEAVATLRDEFGLEVRVTTIFLRGREFHLKLPKYTLWFDMKSPLADHFERLRTLLQAVKPGEITQYVDLRLAGRIVYK